MQCKISLFILFLLLMVKPLKAQQYESFFRAIHTDNNTSISLEWIRPSNGVIAAEFKEYHVYHSDSLQGPYRNIKTILSYNNTNFTHRGVDPQNPHYYFVTTLRKNNDSITSDTLTPIRLKVRSYNSNSTAWLTWNPLKENPPLFDYQYEIHRIIAGQTDEVIALCDTVAYFDNSFHNCNETTIQYYLTLYDSLSRKASRSTDDQDIFLDITQPEHTSIKSVTVIDNQEIELRWEASTASDVARYEIFESRQSGAPWNFLFNVYGTDTTFPGNNICNGEINYVVSAVDSCGNKAPPDYNFAHRVINLSTIKQDVCAQNVHFQWSDYINMNPPLQGYRIIEVDSVGNVINSLSTPPTSEYDLSTLFDSGKQYCYLIEAFNSAGHTSTSCTRCIVGHDPLFPDTLSVTNLSVVSPNTIRVQWFIDDAANSSSLYRMWREGLSSGTRTMVQEATPLQGNLLSFLDTTVNTQNEAYRYFSEAIDSCGTTLSLAPEAQTILLQGQSPTTGVYELDWSEAYNSSHPLQGYRVIRRTNSAVDTLYRGLARSYTDQISNPEINAQGVRYEVIALYKDASSPQRYFSFSNPIFLSSRLKMLNFPNAFTPNGDGLNETFGPIGYLNSQNVKSYQLTIYDRWGKNIYKSDSYNNEWDGTSAGTPVPAGIYLYHAILTTDGGLQLEHRGSVALIK
ncbi:MAG: hypothetical protein CSA95_06950 [Bacteroidetes bacterium]|nr:MAG: hypothetical protein CSA95_06950 [Bacteroidota bacterium]PIE88422.1 MAG: hypothetical protein CSA04_02030 [Bacteroidota bacterium]